MTNHETARLLWGQALEIRASELADDVSKGSWNLCVRRSQEAVELALKAVLRFVGLDYPKRHDVADLFVDAARQRPLPLDSKTLDSIRRISKDLAEQRGLAFYMEKEFGREEAARAVQGADAVLAALKPLLPPAWSKPA
ncbi:MAG: HEPN domain-containing protein [Elusimicrobia bacterium]|nr:HEPN domain-containing protein [Elusimicrobiota bacterium]